jgi:hypothetical protein
MSLFWVLDWGQRLFLYPLIREDITSIGQYTKDITPGTDLAMLPFVIAVVIFLILIASKRAE